ncbi:GntP family permease [Fulvivirgaceae bacterium BMA12]|uniref:GntP family permease n=1 Tax=Agaribacillus aureus TaxID=3051825 RepID=A0ABT8LBQ6_9BACT|nr:GntP family permease [Fulvivirgaceae bacterium BMA12]
MILLLILIICLAFVVISIIRFDLHPFMALLLAAIGFGLLSGMSFDTILQSINDGFGGVLGKIGLIILFGVIIGSFLENSGGAMVLASRILRVIGEKSVHLAMMITGYIISIPVFADSGFIMLHPLNKSLSLKSKLPFAGTTAAMALGLTASHVMVPPTPGPVAAAGILGADLGKVIFFGLIVSVLSLFTCYIFARKYCDKVTVSNPIPAPAATELQQKAPGLFKSFLPVLVPIFLIILNSVAMFPTAPLGQGSLVNILGFIGNPAIALLIGVFLVMTLPERIDKKIISASGWLGKALLTAAPIILITGAGGIFGKVLQNSGIAELVSSQLGNTNLGLWLPFLLAAGLKTAQGSSTVALITTASIVAPLMPALGLESEIAKALGVLAIGAGSAVASHANDSFFWVLTQMTGMNIKEGNQVLSLGTIVFGTTAIIIISILSAFVI